MKSRLFLAMATGLVSTVAASTVSTTITTCDCSTTATATPMWNNGTSLETLVVTSSTTRVVTEVFTPQTTVTLYTNATSMPCNPATTVYETTTLASTLPVTVSTLPTVPILTPPYVTSNSSTPSASTGVPAGPSGWPNPEWSSWSQTPFGTATSSVATKTSTLLTPTHTMWEGSGHILAPPRLFLMLAKVFYLVTPARGQIGIRPYPHEYNESVSIGIGASTKLSPLPEITPTSSATVTLGLMETDTPKAPEGVSFLPLSDTSFWSSTSVQLTVNNSLEKVSSTADAAVPPPSSEVNVTITFYTSNCSISTAAVETSSNLNVTRYSTSVVTANSTITRLITITPSVTFVNTTTPISSSSLGSSRTSSHSTPTMSMHFGGDAASLQVFPGWLAGLGMLMMF